MRDKDNPLVKIVLDSGKVISMPMDEAILAGLLDVDDRDRWIIRDKARRPNNTKRGKRK